MEFTAALLPWIGILLWHVGLIVAVVVGVVALWRGMRAQEEVARRLAAIEDVLSRRNGEE